MIISCLKDISQSQI